MSKKIFIKISAAALMILMFSGCKKELDINHNPSVATVDQATPQLLFPAALLATTAKSGGDLALVGDMWSQYCTQAALAQQYTDIDSYDMISTDAFVSGTYSSWRILYVDGLVNYQAVIDQSKASG